MIFYFSGTGNSAYAASQISRKTGDQICSINERIKFHRFYSGKELETAVFVVPTYAWRIPRLVEQWIRKSDFPSGVKAYFVMTCGDGIGNAPKYVRKLCREKDFVYMGCAQIIMPENYLAMFPVPSEEEACRIIQNSQEKLQATAQRIAEGKELKPEKDNMAGAVCSGPVNEIFYPLFVHAGKFHVDNTCISCGKCVKVCPLDNISMAKGKPEWGKKCTHCMACITQCPAKAIEYGKKSLGKPRYRCPYENQNTEYSKNL